MVRTASSGRFWSVRKQVAHIVPVRDSFSEALPECILDLCNAVLF